MKTIFAAMLAPMFLLATMFLAGGCLVRTHSHSTRHVSGRTVKKCAPSHFWNGRYCEHKGRGHGARKHDY